MTRLFRSNSCGIGRRTNAASLFRPTSPPSPSLFLTNDEDEEDEENEDEEDEDDEEDYEEYFHSKPITTPFIGPERRRQGGGSSHGNYPILAILVSALRKSLVTCSVDAEDVSSTTSSLSSSIDIGCPTDVRHVSHVTFDRFNGFLGLPVELLPEIPRKVPSASVSIFGVSAESMQCSYDKRGNSVPIILLMMQKRLYSGGGLQAEGIFRINAENSQEQYVRNQLNKGFVPRGIDVHCLAGLIKAWFRELPRGVLDSLTPEQVMHCNTEDECTQLVKSLPQTEGALLDWAVNLMSDVVKYEQENKMNARNIAMVFAPNMTQMADPLTALIHAVQVMNLLKTLIIKTLREREECADTLQHPSSRLDPPSKMEDHLCNLNSSEVKLRIDQTHETSELPRRNDRQEGEREEKFWSFQSNSDEAEECNCSSFRSSPKRGDDLDSKLKLEFEGRNENEGILERLSLRKGVKKLCRHPVFQLSKTVKKSSSLGIVNTTRSRGGEACA